MEIGPIVDAVDAFLAERVHGHSPGPGAGAGRAPLGRVEFLRSRSALRRVSGELRRVSGELRRTTAGLLFLRNKLEAEQTERRVRMARACHALLRAAREDDDATALPLLSYRDLLRTSIRRAEEELAGVRTQAADAKAALARLVRAEHRLASQRAARRPRAPRPAEPPRPPPTPAACATRPPPTPAACQTVEASHRPQVVYDRPGMPRLAAPPVGAA